jgi:hypothetical protein
VRQRASIPAGRRAGAAAAPGLGGKSANPRLLMEDSCPNLARGDARIIDRGIRFLRSSRRQCRRWRRRTRVQHVVIWMIKFECPGSWIAAWGNAGLAAKAERATATAAILLLIILRAPCLCEKLTLLLVMLHGVADLLPTILFVPDPFRR